MVERQFYDGHDRKVDGSTPPKASLLRPVAYAEFFNGGVSVTSHCDDVKILHYNYSTLEVLKCIVL